MWWRRVLLSHSLNFKACRHRYEIHKFIIRNLSEIIRDVLHNRFYSRLARVPHYGFIYSHPSGCSRLDYRPILDIWCPTIRCGGLATKWPELGGHIHNLRGFMYYSSGGWRAVSKNERPVWCWSVPLWPCVRRYGKYFMHEPVFI